MFEPVIMIRAGSKVRLLCGVSLQTSSGYVYHRPGSTLEVQSSNNSLSWNLLDENGNVFHDIPAQYLAPSN